MPQLGVWNKFEEIDFELLPEKFVLKTTHDSGNVFVCTDKSKIDVGALSDKFNKALRTNYFYKGREYPYKGVVPRIIAEKYLTDNKHEKLTDYKFFCFHGEPRMLQITQEIDSSIDVAYFDMQFNPLPFTTKKTKIKHYRYQKPECLEEMVAVVSKLSKGIIHVRVDLYCVSKKVYFGEFTFFNASGIINFYPENWDYKLGSLIELPIDVK